MINVETTLDILDIVKILRNTLLPWALIFAVIAFFIYLYQNYIEQDKVSDDDQETGLTIVEKAIKSVGTSIILYLLFPTIALIPLFLINEINTVISTKNPVAQLFKDKLNSVEAQMKKEGYLTGVNESQWKEGSLQVKLSASRIFLARKDINEEYKKFYQPKTNQPNFNSMPDPADTVKKFQLPIPSDSLKFSQSLNADNREDFDDFLTNDVTNKDSVWNLTRKLDFLVAVNFILITLINWLRNAIEYLIQHLFQFLLYMDYLLGLFTALFAIIPYYRQNLLNWLTENISLLCWSFVFILVEWMMSYVSLSSLSTGTQSMESWVIPLLSIITYSGLAYYAAKIIGREAGGGTLATTTRMALSAIPVAGGVAAGMLSSVKSLGTSKAGQMAGGLLLKGAGATMSSLPSGVQGAVKSVGDAVNFFKPQEKPSAMERGASASEELLNVFKNER